MASTKAYTSQIVAITMMALVLSEDAISKRQRRDEIIDSLCQLPGACLCGGSCTCAARVGEPGRRPALPLRAYPMHTNRACCHPPAHLPSTSRLQTWCAAR